MEGESSRSSGKRPFVEDADESNRKPPAKRVKFPKGKKVKPGDEVVAVNKGNAEEEEPIDLLNPLVAAEERAKRKITAELFTEETGVEEPVDLSKPLVTPQERAKRRSQITAELLTEDTRGASKKISAAEVAYEDNENFVDGGIQFEPFNLNKEREEGYFDASGNFVEYVRENEIKDAWLDNVQVDPKYAALKYKKTNNEELVEDLSSKDIGIMKRRIADVLEPGETVLQALRRLKGNSDRKAKMSAGSKVVFDQLTEDAMKLMENGEFNVYHEKKEVFEREAEGYEKLARAKEVDNDEDDFDMFAGDDDEHTTTKPSLDGNNSVTQPSTDAVNSGGASQNDYVYDESSGYYYSSSLGYYYDPNTGLYCSAASGQWYSFNAETNTYDEIHEAASTAS